MKRREYGINLDDGVALSTEDEFRLLYVPCNPELTTTLQGWFADDTQESILLGGQIGSGKTTLLKEVSRSYDSITVSFDTDPLEPTESGYSILLFGKIIQACVAAEVDVDGCGVALSDFPSVSAESWSVFAGKISTCPSSLQDAESLQDVCAVIAKHSGLMLKACGMLLDRLREATSRQPVIIAEGIDKFRPYTADYFSLKNILVFLAHRKTLFEVNAVHLFTDHIFPVSIKKLFVGSVDDDLLSQMLWKRLGSYAPVYQDAIPLIIRYSGGNARQALRLLSAYYFQRTQHNHDQASAMALACHQVGKDTLSIPYSNFPVDIFTVVKRDAYMEGSLFNGRDSVVKGANDAVYHNWLLVQKTPGCDSPTQWPAIINPLIDATIKIQPTASRSSEEEAVREWALENDTSFVGLSASPNKHGEPAWDEFWTEIVSSLESESLKIVGLLKEIGAGLFGIERQDRIIVAYKDSGCVKAVRDFLVGEANTYSALPCKEIMLVGGEGHNPIVDLMINLAKKDAGYIYSIELSGEWTESQLRDLDHRRDVFCDLQMLWWVQSDDLKKYLRLWPQLRQLFRVYQLEDDLWQGITAEQIQADIEFIKDISKDPDPEGARRLLNVLTYLNESRGES